MAGNNRKAGKGSEGLWIPNEIRNIPLSILDHLGKQIFAHIFTFGAKGCYQSNETMAEIFMVCARTVGRRIAAIKKAGLVYVKCPKGYYRTLWAKSHPDVKEAVKLWYYNREIPKSLLESGQKLSGSLRQGCPSELDRVGQVTATKRVFPPGQGCPPTNTETRKETNRDTAADLPLPAGGQANRLLTDRKAAATAKIERLGWLLGSGVRKEAVKLTPDEFARRQREQVDRLRASEAMRTNVANVI